jgi:hypothetical protein
MSFVNHLHRHHDLGRGRSRSGVRGRNSKIDDRNSTFQKRFPVFTQPRQARPFLHARTGTPQMSPCFDSSRLDDRPATLNFPPFGEPPVRAPKPAHFPASFDRQSADVTNLPDWLDDQPVPGETQPSAERHVTEERR